MKVNFTDFQLSYLHEIYEISRLIKPLIKQTTYHEQADQGSEKDYNGSFFYILLHIADSANSDMKGDFL